MLRNQTEIYVTTRTNQIVIMVYQMSGESEFLKQIFKYDLEIAKYQLYSYIKIIRLLQTLMMLCNFKPREDGQFVTSN